MANYANRGTLEQYQANHLKAQQDSGWTEEEIANGKIGFVMGVPAPENQHTTAIYSYTQKPDGSDDCAWVPTTIDTGLTVLDEAEYDTLIESWFPED